MRMVEGVGTPRRRRATGFTLVEVMIVAAILAILTVLALPSYSEFVNRSHRGDARSALLVAAQHMERLRGERDSYRPGGVTPVLPADLARSPRTGAIRYNLTVATPNGASYTISAAPAGTMVGDLCGSLAIDQTGLRSFTGGTGTMERCWEK